jgi:peptidoglycan hydrolase CwlO-like protein
MGKAIARYKSFRDSSAFFLKADAAYDLLDWIERGKALGLIIPQNVMAKLKECQDENNELKEEKDKLEKECQRLKQENIELHRTLDHFGERGNISEVKDEREK